MAANNAKEAIAQRVRRLTDIADEPHDFLMPVDGYRNVPIVSLEEAVKPLLTLLPAVLNYVELVKDKCENPKDGLTQDESASIMLYSMEWKPFNECLYGALNATLRASDRNKLKPWYLYLKLFLTALFRLPTIPHLHVYRGVRLDMSDLYEPGSTVVWWAFSSCTRTLPVLQSEQFLGTTGVRTLFNIDCNSGRSIKNHSFYASEDEVLLLAATQFEVVGSLYQGSGLQLIQLKETIPPYPLLQPVLPTSIFTPEKQVKEVRDERSQEKTTNNTVPKSIQNNNASSNDSKIRNDTRLETDQQSRKPDFSTPLPCKGRRCTTCGRCCDWYYAGRPEDWEWIRNIRNWTEDDVQHWRSDTYRDNFKLHEGGTCTRAKHYRVSYLVNFITLGAFDGSLLVRHLCPCPREPQRK